MKSPKNRNKGAALVIVLSILTILVTLVLAFFSMVQTESKSSANFAESVEVRNLTDVPVNLAISQLRKATENLGPVGADTYFKTWSSQPGMIRVFGVEPDSANVRSKTVALYKLYSDDAMVVAKSGANSSGSGMANSEVAASLRQDTDDLGIWDTKPGMFTDLNEPVPVPGTTPSYKFPILDPRAAVAGPGGYAVDGFKVFKGGDPSAPSGAASVAGTVTATSRTDLAARVPMPVRWLYILKDGTTITPTSADATKATFTTTASASAPTSQNPIVGRVAFWTDDDSNKININTSSEGSGWEIPVSTSQTDKDFASRVPAQNEFSRYPGHPATTSLSTVFQAFGTDFFVDATTDPNTAVFARLHKLSPRTPWGGTMAGTTTPGTATTGLPAKQERLYASVEEMFFDPARQQNLSGLDPTSLELGKFFLTAHSRAPELNIYGKPRISLWPQSKDVAQRNPKDKLLAFMSETTGTTTRQWYWVREKNFKSASDPGSSQDPTTDYPGTSRNDSMFSSYFRALTGGAGNASGVEAPLPPGFGVKSFRDKYGAEQRDELGTCMFDLLRWGVNSYSSVSTTGWPTYTYLPDRVSGNKGQSSAAPLIIEKSRGFGRWPTITEAAIVFMRVKATKAGEKDKLQAYVLLEPFVPTSGPACMTPNIIYRIQGMDGFKVKVGSETISLGFSGTMDNVCPTTEGAFGLLACGNAPFTGMGNMVAGTKKDANGNIMAKVPLGGSNGGDPDIYPFVSKAIDIPDGSADFTFLPTSFTIKTYPGWTGAVQDAKLVQTINMSFPGQAILKLPRANATYNTLDSRFNRDGGRYEPRLVADGDIARSVEAAVGAAPKGDLRMYAAVKEVPSSWFASHEDYANTNVERRQFLRTDFTASNGQFGPWTGAARDTENWGEQSGRMSAHTTAGTLVKGFTYSRGSPPAVPRGLDGAMLTLSNGSSAPGDWDNGVGIIADGPYIRKPDEGNSIGSPYMTRHQFDKETGVSYSPNRQIASAVAFGSLPTGLKPTTNPPQVKPWQTLLFCPNPPSRVASPTVEPTEQDHPGFGMPRDHLMLDLFWMPITEPYAISEPLSTAGKINMNYQMAPFTHIERSTGLRAVLKSTRMTAISPSSAGGKSVGVQASNGSGPYNKSGAAVYKNTDAATTHSYELHYAVNADVTLEGFKNRFKTGDIFRTATEICEIFLVPQRLKGSRVYAPDAVQPPVSYDEMTKWWNGDINALDAMELTGDNSREAPYNHLYPRLTTKSNTFTVHYRVQTLKKARSSAVTDWVEGNDTVASEYRGSTTLERYLDPNEAQLANAMVGAGSFKYSWDTYYRIRIIQRKQFTP